MKVLSSFSILFFGFFVLAMVCGDLAAEGSQIDDVAPVILHSPPENSQFDSHRDMLIVASVSDDQMLESVTLFYRKPGEMQFSMMPMHKGAEAHIYTAALSVSILTHGVEYYIQAQDKAGNTGLYGFSFAPLQIIPQANSDKASVALVKDAFEPNKEGKNRKESASSRKKWLWIGLGVLAVGAAASAGGGGSSSDGTGNVDIIGPVP